MKWTKQHSENAVAARACRRIEQAEAMPQAEPKRRLAVPRKQRARFTIQIRDHAVGDSLTLNLHPAPWPNRWLCEQGQFSSARLGRAVTLILTGGT